jgi:hypothetical protein
MFLAPVRIRNSTFAGNACSKVKKKSKKTPRGVERKKHEVEIA